MFMYFETATYECGYVTDMLCMVHPWLLSSFHFCHLHADVP